MMNIQAKRENVKNIFSLFLLNNVISYAQL